MEQHKLAIISSDGKIKKRGDRTVEKLLHATCLLEFIKEEYPNNETLKRLTIKHTANTIGFFLTLYGNIVVFNTTRYDEKHGKNGFVMMPDNFTETQQESLEGLLRSIPTYSIRIAYNMKVTDGILEGKEIASTEKIPPIQVLEMYYQKVGRKKQKGSII